jgi:D-alanyl-D-alanine carboxypeptidase
MRTGRRANLFFFGWMILLCLQNSAVVYPQTPETKVADPSPSSRASLTITPSAAASVSSDAVTAPPLYGYQSVLIETLDGEKVASQYEDTPFNPASAIKLATALVALRTFGPNYRFTTGIWIDGKFEKSTGTVEGNLYISGRDPSFHSEHAIMIALQLNKLGIRTVNGDLIVAPGFTMNFNWSARRSGERLYDTLDASLRSAEATRSWTYERTALADRASLETTPSVAVMGDVYVTSVPTTAKLLLTHNSSKLVDILKVLLCYSNNFMAERIGESCGGKDSVERQLIETLHLSPSELRLNSLSGLGENRVTPRAMMKIFRALREELRKFRLSTTDIMPVAGIDPGTLQDRFTDPSLRGSVIAKTGTLTRTDRGASSLVGQMRTGSNDILLFVIMNQDGSIQRFRENQDNLVMQVQKTRGGPKAFDYKPLTLAMKLSDTSSTVASDAEEYEPASKVGNSP